MSKLKETKAERKSADHDGDAPDLSAVEHQEAEEQKRPRAAVIHEAVRTGGEEELKRRKRFRTLITRKKRIDP